MADASSSTATSGSDHIEINIRAPGDKKVTVSISPSQSVGELKAVVAEKTDIEADRQRLIYSGRVLKDEEKIDVYKIRPGDTVHLVKGASKAPAPPSSAQVPQSIATGQQVAGNPLAPLMNPMNPGIGNFNPFAEMGLNANDPNMIQTMMNSPEAQQQMRSMLSNPAVIDQIIDASPELRNMGPQMREIMQSEQFRNMMANLQQMAQMMRQAEQMRSMFGGGAGGGGAGGFPALGGMGGGTDPWGAAFGGGGQPTQAVAGAGTGQPAAARGPTNLFNPQPPSGGAAGGQAAGFGGTGPGAGGMPDLAQMQQLLGMAGGAGGMAGFGGMGGRPGFGQPAQPAAPQDSRPPEERFSIELGQLQEMGFVNAQANVRALLASGGNVQAAIEYILSSQSW